MDTYRRSAGRIGAAVAIAGLAMMIAVSFIVPFIPTGRAATVDVSISGDAFHPQTTTVNAGDTVRWTNNDAVEHTVTSNTGAWTEIDLLAGAQGSVTFNTPGTFAYHCRIHPFMTGSVVVEGVIPEFSSELFVVIGLTMTMFGLMAVRRMRA